MDYSLFAVKMFYNHAYLIGSIYTRPIFMQLLPNVEQKICPKQLKYRLSHSYARQLMLFIVNYYAFVN